MNENWAGPLGGVKVIDFTRVLAGPFSTQVLADLGAEVIKIEAPGEGDDTRAFPPFRDGESHYFVSLNHDKKSVVLDLRRPEGAEIARGLIRTADVVIENFRPGVMDRLGLGYKALSELNPRLVYCSISGFGLTGPLKDRPSFDVVTQAMSGVMSINGKLGDSGTKLGLPMGDLVGGVFSPVAIVSALLEREQTGKGRMIDVSLLDGMLGMLGYFAQIALFQGEDPQPVGSSHVNIVPYGSFTARDGAVVIACLTDVFWEKLCKCLGLDSLLTDERYTTMEGRKLHRETLEAAIEAKTKEHTMLCLQAKLDEFDVPNAPVLGITDALTQPHAKARDMLVNVEHETIGQLPVVGRPVKFPGASQRDIQAPPTLGQHTEEVLQDYLGLDVAEIQELKENGILQ